MNSKFTVGKSLKSNLKSESGFSIFDNPASPHSSPPRTPGRDLTEKQLTEKCNIKVEKCVVKEEGLFEPCWDEILTGPPNINAVPTTPGRPPGRSVLFSDLDLSSASASESNNESSSSDSDSDSSSESEKEEENLPAPVIKNEWGVPATKVSIKQEHISRQDQAQLRNTKGVYGNVKKEKPENKYPNYSTNNYTNKENQYEDSKNFKKVNRPLRALDQSMKGPDKRNNSRDIIQRPPSRQSPLVKLENYLDAEEQREKAAEATKAKTVVSKTESKPEPKLQSKFEPYDSYDYPKSKCFLGNDYYFMSNVNKLVPFKGNHVQYKDDADYTKIKTQSRGTSRGRFSKFVYSKKDKLYTRVTFIVPYRVEVVDTDNECDYEEERHSFFKELPIPPPEIKVEKRPRKPYKKRSPKETKVWESKSKIKRR